MTMTAQVNARVPKDLKRLVQYLTMLRGDSLSHIVREALEDYVAQSDEEIKELARRIDEKAK